jgi:hypothetical protein
MGQSPRYKLDGSIETDSWDYDAIFAVAAGSLLLLFFPVMALLLWWQGLIWQ